MFFGAGNLIFPPSLGLLAGDSWVPGIIGFLLTGIGMPLLGIIAVARAGGELSDMADKVSPTFSKILGTVIMLAIGPLLAIPRTGATTFEMGVKPLFPGVSPIIVSIIYFGITLFFVINPSGVIDKIGKILTPALLIALAIIIFKGVTTPIGAPISTGMENPFSRGFTEGYQTMDALASMVFGGIVIGSIAAKGYDTTKDQIKLTIMAGTLAALGLALVYGGLMYLGATVSGTFPADIPKTDLVVAITERLLGNAGKGIIGIAVALACLTTSIGLTATCGNYFNKLSNGKWSYKAVVIVVTVFSALMANFGVETIVKIAVPLLVTVYPVGIVLIIMNVFDDFIPNKAAYPGAAFGALCVSIFDALAAMGMPITSVSNVIAKLPLASQGFSWLTPAIIGSIITMFVLKKKEQNI